MSRLIARSLGAAALAGAAALLLLTGCGGQDLAPAEAQPDDATLHQDIAQDRSGAEVTFDGNLVAGPSVSNGHQRLYVRTGSGDLIEVDHNISLASQVPAHQGDRVVVRGQLYIDSPTRIGVHCTHRDTSRGCPVPGFIVYQGHTYA